MSHLSDYKTEAAILVTLSALCATHIACALYSPTSNSTPVTTTCSVPNDQTGTITGHWSVTPVPIAFHQGDFNTTETTSMTLAADTWNSFFTSSKTIKTLDYGGTAVRTSASVDPTQNGTSVCGLGILQATQFVGNVVIYKTSRWPANYPATAIALTTTCFLQAQPYPTFYMAIMEINYQSFFTQGNKVPDLQSIVLHELGHLHGLNHTCESFAKTGTPNCTDPGLDPNYISASMFPTFSFDTTGAGELRRSLGVNDQSRANCLYTGPSGSSSPTPTSTSTH